MNRRNILAFLIFLLSCSTITGTAHAQTSVGVAPEDVFTYEFSAYFVSDNPDAVVPQQLVEDNKTEWVRFVITEVVNSTVYYGVLQHLTNGTEITSQSEEDVATGVGGFPIIRANVSANEVLYESMSTSFVNETLTRTYEGGTRTVLRVIWNDTDYIDAYFDRETGMPVELHVRFIATEDGYAEYVYQLIDSSVWAIPEFPSALALPLLAAAIAVAALFYRRTLKPQKTPP
ncbi:MAG: hypothetical protein ACE14S_12695 [Candidatus Bathyarchaeia archaeon]